MKGVQMTSSRAVLITVAQVCVIVIILHRLYPRLRAAPSFPAKSVARDRKNQGRNRLEVRALRLPQLPQLPLTFSLIFSGSRDICKIRRAYSWRIYNLSDPLNLIDLFRWSIFFLFWWENFIPSFSFHQFAMSASCLTTCIVQVQRKSHKFNLSFFCNTTSKRKKPKPAENDKSKSRKHKISYCL